MGAAVGAFLCVVVFALPVGLLIGAVILRGGVSFANKCLPKPRSRDWDDDDDDDWDRPARRRSRGSAAIPEPALGKAMGIVFVQFIVGFVISIPINLAVGGGMPGPAGARGGGAGGQELALLASLAQLPIGFLVAAGLRTAMLPTTFPRACLVVLFEYLIIFAICLAVGVPLMILLFAAGR